MGRVGRHSQKTHTHTHTGAGGPAGTPQLG